jgi:hypothetical protein
VVNIIRWQRQFSEASETLVCFRPYRTGVGAATQGDRGPGMTEEAEESGQTHRGMWLSRDLLPDCTPRFLDGGAKRSNWVGSGKASLAGVRMPDWERSWTWGWKDQSGGCCGHSLNSEDNVMR